MHSMVVVVTLGDGPWPSSALYSWVGTRIGRCWAKGLLPFGVGVGGLGGGAFGSMIDWSRRRVLGEAEHDSERLPLSHASQTSISK